MLVVGDQAPYEDAAVSSRPHVFQFEGPVICGGLLCAGCLLWCLAKTDCVSLLWPPGGVQQQNGSNYDLIP